MAVPAPDRGGTGEGGARADGFDYVDTARGLRVTRGGSWYSATTSRLNLAYREEFQPELSSNDLGSRIAALPLP